VSASDRPADLACDQCLRRPWLLAILAGHLDRTGPRLSELLELDDVALLRAVAGHSRRGRLERRLAGFDPGAARGRARQAGVHTLCRCRPEYPERLLDLPSPPAVLHIAGGLDRFLSLVQDEPVALVGTRRPTGYGLDVGRMLARGLAASGLAVISGMAQGIDSIAHDGALAAQGPTLAVLACSPERPHPASRRALHQRILTSGAAVSELPPGTSVWRWMFPARNRLIAALAAITVVVEAAERSGALLTASWARSLGRPVAAVPGRITTKQAAGPHRLLAEGARLVTSPQDVLDLLYGLGARRARPDHRAELEPELRRWLMAIAEGHDTPAALSRVGLPPEESLQVLSTLELTGHIRREPGGRFAVMP
jgi:DNA processing protein